MITEKEFIFNILKNRGVVTTEGQVDRDRFKKLITEDWLWKKSIMYNFIAEEKKDEVIKIDKDTFVIEEAPTEEAPIEESVTEEPVLEENVTEEPKKSKKSSKK